MSKTIILMRHGKVDIDTRARIDALSMKEWVKRYDSSPLNIESRPSQRSIESVCSSEYIFSSQLRRTHDSAKILGVFIDEEDALFNEADIPTVEIPFLKIRPKTWLIILRLLLILRMGKTNSSFQMSKKRAYLAALKLIEKSKEYEKIALIGHGGLNWLIGQVLTENGWRLLSPTSNKNWGLRIYTI
jgi:broad specificity phosphatase PhoE